MTKFDPDTFETGLLFGDSTIRSVERDLSNLIVRPVREIGSGKLNNLAAVGIKVSETGALTLDESRLQDALDDRFDEVRDLFTRQAKLSNVTTLDDLRNGQGIDDTTGDDFRVRLHDGTTFDVDVASANSVGQLLTLINSDPGNPGTLTAAISSDGFSIELIDSSVGAQDLEVTALNGSQAPFQLGIRKTVSGGGSVLRGSILNVKNDPGVGQRISERLDFITNGRDGILETRTGSLDDQIDGFNKEIDRVNTRLAGIEERLVKQFARLESFIAESQATMARISGQFDNLNAAFKSGIKK